MSVIDILFRVDDICKKYEKYDLERQEEINGVAGDSFARLYNAVEAEIDKALIKSERASTETNRAAAAAMKAEVRRTKARLMEEVPKMEKLARKKVKGISKEDREARSDLVLALRQRIEEIPDGIATSAKPTSPRNSKFDLSGDGNFTSDFFEQTEESSQFRQEYEMRKLKQDEGLDVISEGLDTLKNLAHGMNEELDKQVPLMDDADKKVDKATAELKKTNVRLKETLFQIRSSRNFCIDIILLCVILGIGTYLYKVLSK